jgi:Leucine-rich repeat (LRR) protein
LIFEDINLESCLKIGKYKEYQKLNIDFGQNFMKTLFSLTLFLIYFSVTGQDTITSFYIQTPMLKCSGIPDTVFKIKSLKNLIISGVELDEDFLDNKGNWVEKKCYKLTVLPSFIGQLENLEILNLYLNALDSLPKEIVKCSKLKEINLSENNISNIDNLVLLENLEVLFLNECKLTKLPNNICYLRKLKKLDLTGNELSKVELLRIKKALPKCEIIYGIK